MVSRHRARGYSAHPAEGGIRLITCQLLCSSCRSHAGPSGPRGRAAPRRARELFPLEPKRSTADAHVDARRKYSAHAWHTLACARTKARVPQHACTGLYTC